jgi:RNA polymerase sigma-70 factor (ECF subfamily)
MLYTASQILGKEGAEEAVQDVFVKLLDKFEKDYEILSDKPGQYFVIMVKNHSLNLLKKNHSDILSFEDEFINQDIFESNEAVPEETLLYNETVEQLAMYIRRLTPATRQVLEYKYIEGYSNIEISEMLDISQTAVSSRIDRAKNRLKEMLESEGFVDVTH